MNDTTATVIRAEQVLTMTGWDDKPALAASGTNDLGTALIERDRELLGLVEDAAITIVDGVIASIDPFHARPQPGAPVTRTRLAMPAWVECHTHAIFGTDPAPAGDRMAHAPSAAATPKPSSTSNRYARAAEFGLRNAGVPYVEILERGGGILSTVASTRAASDETLKETLAQRLWGFAARGCGVVEVKTGYGLSVSEELRHLRLVGEVMDSLAATLPMRVLPTFLGAHAVPAEWRHDPAGYVDLVVEEMIPAVVAQGIAEHCDVFCDRGAFDLAQSERILGAALDAGLSARIHAEEIVYTGGAEMAAGLGALSADHLDNLDASGVEALAGSGCVGVLLPGVTAFLDLEARPPARALVDAGAAVALSTDFNPGSAMTMDLRLMTTLGCTLLKLTPGEALWAVTAGAARALGLADAHGVLKAGRRADLALFDEPEYAAVPYQMGDTGRRPTLWLAGAPVTGSPPT